MTDSRGKWQSFTKPRSVLYRTSANLRGTRSIFWKIERLRRAGDESHSFADRRGNTASLMASTTNPGCSVGISCPLFGTVICLPFGSFEIHP